jgi:hypothetical protein
VIGKVIGYFVLSLHLKQQTHSGFVLLRKRSTTARSPFSAVLPNSACLPKPEQKKEKNKNKKRRRKTETNKTTPIHTTLSF